MVPSMTTLVEHSLAQPTEYRLFFKNLIKTNTTFLIERSHSVAVYESKKGTFLKNKALGLGFIKEIE